MVEKLTQKVDPIARKCLEMLRGALGANAAISEADGYRPYIYALLYVHDVQQ